MGEGEGNRVEEGDGGPVMPRHPAPALLPPRRLPALLRASLSFHPGAGQSRAPPPPAAEGGNGGGGIQSGGSLGHHTVICPRERL